MLRLRSTYMSSHFDNSKMDPSSTRKKPDKINPAVTNNDGMLITSSQFYLSALDPLFHSHVNILIRTLRHMIPVKGHGQSNPPLSFFCFPPSNQPRPIRNVSVAGIVVYSNINSKVSFLFIKSKFLYINCTEENKKANSHCKCCSIIK